MIVLLTGDYIEHDEKVALQKLSCQPHETFPEHTHTFIELVYIWRGTGTQLINGQGFPVQRGDLIWINPGDYHSFTSPGEMQYINLLFEPDFLSEQERTTVSDLPASYELSPALFREFGGKVPGTACHVSFRGKPMLELEGLLDAMMEEFTAKKEGYRSMLRGYTTLLLTRTFRMMQKNLAGTEHRDACNVLPGLLTYIEEHYTDRITLQDLSRESFYSPYYIGKIFKEQLGSTFTEYVQEIRLREAKRLLLETDETAEAIGRSVGYPDKTQFYRIFKQAFGLTPQQMRKQG
ncbi:AraC family transcriptional regulator [Paenibacillus aurantius]|uniref:AraC family transcriptional regulator n=1 Tax=Paenibacillus aurantius TaxID=2918900 RepID=A0AA96RBI7_9BACL|nr:AraC family transcriptional regulator [Paenibacillus aurantius]WNQ09490.1 AraC family transcriptional regulator [Paenibacillus aurantius]